MTISRPMQFGILGLLALLLLATRGHHFASVDALPSASWAVFFLAGLFFRPIWGFAALFALASMIDFSMLDAGQIGAHCLSASYLTLIPAYGALWFAGRVYARVHQDRAATLLPLGLSLIVGGLIAALSAKGGYYFFSDNEAAPTFAGLVSRIAHAYPAALGTLAMYVGVAALAYVTARKLRPAAPLIRVAR